MSQKLKVERVRCINCGLIYDRVLPYMAACPSCQSNATEPFEAEPYSCPQKPGRLDETSPFKDNGDE